MAVTRLNEHMVELEQERDSARAQLNALMGRRPDEPVEISGSYATPIALPAIEELEQTAIEHRPELAALRQQMTTSREEGHLDADGDEAGLHRGARLHAHAQRVDIAQCVHGGVLDEPAALQSRPT